MVKAVVRSMDAIQAVGSKNLSLSISNFVVSGGSKRGIVSWLTSGVDARVSGVAPLIAPVANLTLGENRVWQAFGTWPYAYTPYAATFNRYLNDPHYTSYSSDPAYYNDIAPYKNIPKLIVTASGDEFFPLDMTRVFSSYLNGPAYYSVLPQTGHGLTPTAIVTFINNLIPFYVSVAKGKPYASYTYTLIRSNSTTTPASVTLSTPTKPDAILLWTKTITPGVGQARNFIGTAGWSSSPLSPASTSPSFKYVASVPVPSVPGTYTAFYIQIVQGPITLSSEVNITPDTLPFPPCKCGAP
eukprot:TRINITY_DN3037_c0_g1_i1.p1 TRINITY_DN3037_c0_g1~~TRINITY_DN3037_c0_g1_i1.p1  ORF type:complete len:299 (-),score=56.00 TRINITY_DN3037_c0_g1_i1:236-1132(-)